MANWQGAILTNKGRSLQAKVEGGLCQLALTKLKTGDGTLAPGQTLEALTDLVSPKQNIGISAVVVDEDQPGVVYVKGILSNASLTTGYLVKELGLFATDPDDGEILYAVTVDSNPDYLQDNTSATVITEALKLAIAVSNTSDVVATLDPEGLLTVEDMDIHNADEDAHDGILQKVSTLLADVVTHLASSAAISISSLNTNSVFYRLLQYALTAAGVQYNFTNSSAWYICLGALFGGLIIQGGKESVRASSEKTITLPIALSAFAICQATAADPTAGATGHPFAAVIATTTTLKIKGYYSSSSLSYFWLAVGH
jgi:hypothetical protein